MSEDRWGYALLEAARRRATEGDFARVAALLEPYASQFPTEHRAQALLLLGGAQRRLGLFTSAYTALQAAFEAGSTVAAASELGHLLASSADWLLAQHWFSIAADAAGTNVGLHMNAGAAAERIGEVAVAERRYRTAVALEGDASEATLALGSLLYRSRRFTAAAAALRSSVKPDAQLLLALATALSGNPAEASRLLGALVGACRPPQGKHFAGLAALKCASVRWHKAIAEIRNGSHFAVIDDAFSSEALAAIRDHLTDRRRWVAATRAGERIITLTNGLYDAAVLACAAEVCDLLQPALPGSYFQTAWAYRYDLPTGVGDPHADDATITVNFWTTPDVAHQNKEAGGLLIWDVEVPSGYFKQPHGAQVNAATAAIAARRPERIAYRCGRAVIFRSRCIHQTDQYQFLPTQEGRRFNVSLLYSNASY